MTAPKYLTKPVPGRVPKRVGRVERVNSGETMASVHLGTKADAWMFDGKKTRAELYARAKAGDAEAARLLWARYRIRAIPPQS